MAFNIERIDKAAKQIAKFAKKDEKRPAVESIHKLRTNTRRLESALNALQRNSSHDTTGDCCATWRGCGNAPARCVTWTC